MTIDFNNYFYLNCKIINKQLQLIILYTYLKKKEKKGQLEDLKLI